jgi:hypothetical protein
MSEDEPRDLPCAIHYTIFVFYSPTEIRNINPLQPSGHYMYRQFNIQQFSVPATVCFV